MSSRPLFALIIGIDDYTEKTELRKLKGAVADADRVQRWIRTKFNGARIRNLRNSEAKRDSIIKELQGLSTAQEIERDDPILIFYAGHGIEGNPPKEWHSTWDSPKIQMIAPWDYGRSDSSGRAVEGIPDFTLGFLLRKIADSKGNNITVILDCCHSGSGTRSDSDTRVRGGPHLGPIPPDLDRDLLDYDLTRGIRVQDKFRHRGLSSHVLLAACAPHEEAKEHGTSGAFTRALLRVLENDYINTAEITYEGLTLNFIEKLPSQTPQCEGINRSRFLFDRKLSNNKPIYKAKLKNRQLIIEGAGACQGTLVGSTFAVWSAQQDVQTPPFTTVVISHVKAHESIAPFDMTSGSSNQFLAQILKNLVPQLLIHVPEQIQKIKCFRDLMSGTEDRPPPEMTIAEDKALASIGLTYLVGHEEIGFELLNPEERRQKICHTIPATADDLHWALKHLCHYYYHLNRVKTDPPTLAEGDDKALFSSKLTIELFKLQEVEDGEVPEGQNLNATVEGVELVIGPANKEDNYGLRIVNKTNFPVFPYLFYFNSSSFSITSIYEPVATARAEAGDSATAPLRANGSLTIGYGSGGGRPHNFFFSNQDLYQEQGYLRLFVSGKPVDISHLPQGPISEQSRGMKSSHGSGHSTVWDVITVPVVLKREEMIGVIGTRKDGKSVFIDQLFKLLDGKNIKIPPETNSNARIKEYNITLPEPERSFVLVDLPDFQSPNLEDQAAVLKEVVEYLGKQYNSGRRFKSLVWCYNISKPKFTAIDGLNADLVNDIAGPGKLKNLTVLTTDWNTGAKAGTNSAAGTRSLAGVTSPLDRYHRMEDFLKSRFDGVGFKRLGTFNPSESAERERMLGSASAEDPAKLIRSLLSNETQPKKLQVQDEVEHLGQRTTLGGTTAGRRLRDRFQAEIKKKESLIQTLEAKIGKSDKQDKRRRELQDERSRAKSDIAGWKERVESIDSGRLNLQG